LVRAANFPGWLWACRVLPGHQRHQPLENRLPSSKGLKFACRQLFSRGQLHRQMFQPRLGGASSAGTQPLIQKGKRITGEPLNFLVEILSKQV